MISLSAFRHFASKCVSSVKHRVCTCHVNRRERPPFNASYVFQMSDELVKQLSSYRAQLQQVEAALSTDPENEDLLKLQKDLQVRLLTVPMPVSVAQMNSRITVTVVQTNIYCSLVTTRVNQIHLKNVKTDLYRDTESEKWTVVQIHRFIQCSLSPRAPEAMSNLSHVHFYLIKFCCTQEQCLEP